MTVISRLIDYHAVNSAGTTVKIFAGLEALDRAKAWVKSREAIQRHGFMEVHEVEVSVTSRRVYRPRSAPRLVVPEPPPISALDGRVAA